MTKCFRRCRISEIDVIFYAGRNPDLAEKKDMHLQIQPGPTA